MPSSVYVCIQILLRGFPCADSITRVVIREDVAVDTSAQTDVEAAHLTEIHSITVRKEHSVPIVHKTEGLAIKLMA